MNLQTMTWTKKTYASFVKRMHVQKDEQYKQFHSKLILNETPVIGIPTPILKKWAKEISKTNYEAFISFNSHQYYEEVILHGLLLGYINVTFLERLTLLEAFMPYNTNWAINDIVCANLKEFKQYRELGYSWILKCLHSQNPWEIRFGFVLLLDHYMDIQYIDSILDLCQKKYMDTYYVNMAIAWLLSTCYIHFPKKTLPILEKKTLSSFIHRKTISKICDSYRVSTKQKDYLRKLR